MTDIIFIHRGRNEKSKEMGRMFTRTDYNFDFRGKSKIALLLKAMLTATEIPKADVYFVEGGVCLNAAYFVKLFKATTSKIVLMVPEPFFNLENVSKIKQWYIKRMLKKVDGIIAVSRMVADDARKVYNGPIELGHHYPVNIDRFLKARGDLDSKRLVFVGDRPSETGYTKGLDIVIEAFKMLKEREPDAELFLIGAGTENLDYGVQGIHYMGFQKPEEIFKRCSVIVSPGRYDAFPIAIVEACCSGVIPIISNRTGSKEFVDSSLVVDSWNPEDYAEAIRNVWEMSRSKRKALSDSLNKKAKVFDKEYCKNEFRKAWGKLL